MELDIDVFDIILEFLDQYHRVRLREVCRSWCGMATCLIRKAKANRVNDSLLSYPLSHLKLRLFSVSDLERINNIPTLRELVINEMCTETLTTLGPRLREDIMVTIKNFLPTDVHSSRGGMPSYFFLLTQLRNLNANDLTIDVEGIPNLRRLSISSVFTDISNLSKLESLTLYYDATPSKIRGLKNLTSLCLSMVSPNMENYVTLTTIRDLHLVSVPQNAHLIEKFPLRKLTIFTMSMIRVERMTKLQKLSIYSLDTDLPQNLENIPLRSLKIVNMNFDRMRYTCLPKTLRTLHMPLELWWKFRKQIKELPLEKALITPKYTEYENTYDKMRSKEIGEMLKKKDGLIWINKTLREKFEFS
ncbi:hypothetical protein BNJ_00335 [Kaumoebavirus]|uniref:hypothetical protein n=1 Tax=Kaumoebavirus TaxID=1859492 RepID=UPI0009C23ADF|nr:hypothetical protein BNJ_00335 [Kaumoebavirus]ARA72155.1 hypothetical protein BNJ_00335 [Kaumoebavirus]